MPSFRPEQMSHNGKRLSISRNLINNRSWVSKICKGKKRKIIIKEQQNVPLLKSHKIIRVEIFNKSESNSGS